MVKLGKKTKKTTNGRRPTTPTPTPIQSAVMGESCRVRASFSDGASPDAPALSSSSSSWRRRRFTASNQPMKASASTDGVGVALSNDDAVVVRRRAPSFPSLFLFLFFSFCFVFLSLIVLLLLLLMSFSFFLFHLELPLVLLLILPLLRFVSCCCCFFFLFFSLFLLLLLLFARHQSWPTWPSHSGPSISPRTQGFFFCFFVKNWHRRFSSFDWLLLNGNRFPFTFMDFTVFHPFSLDVCRVNGIEFVHWLLNWIALKVLLGFNLVLVLYYRVLSSNWCFFCVSSFLSWCHRLEFVGYRLDWC